MYKLGIIGYPLGHSISAAIHTAAMKSVNTEGVYDVLETPPEELISRLKFLKTQNYTGFNITIPLKVPVSLFLDEIDDYANIAGCVNTVKINADKTLFGYNTDIYGFKMAIPLDINLKGKNASILGTGGASRAAVVGLIERGVTEIDMYSRNVINANQTINYLRNQFPDVKFTGYQIQNIRDLSHTAIVVNSTPIGMRGYMMNESPLEESDIKKLNPETIVYDIVYNPIKTKLITMAQQHGLRTIGGLDMLIMQAQRAQIIWTGKTPDANVMKIAALEALNEM